jgi:hypothetical protein
VVCRRSKANPVGSPDPRIPHRLTPVQLPGKSR